MKRYDRETCEALYKALKELRQIVWAIGEGLDSRPIDAEMLKPSGVALRMAEEEPPAVAPKGLAPEALEAAMREYCGEGCTHPDCPPGPGRRYCGSRYTNIQDIITAYLAHRRAQGVAEMPREPTDAMLALMQDDYDFDNYQGVWDAHDKEQSDDR